MLTSLSVETTDMAGDADARWADADAFVFAAPDAPTTEAFDVTGAGSAVVYGSFNVLSQGASESAVAAATELPSYWVVASGGNKHYQGTGQAYDMLSFQAYKQGVSVVLYNDSFVANRVLNSTYSGFERFTGTSFDDRFVTSYFTHSFDTGSIVFREAIIDRMELRGGPGDDFMGATRGSRSIFDGGSGNDTVSYYFEDKWFNAPRYDVSNPGVNVSLLRGKGWTGDAAGDRLIDVENLEGSALDDILTGDRGDNVLTGRGGRDTLIGNAGNDTLYGGVGNFIDQYNQMDPFIDVAVFNYNRDQYIIRDVSIRLMGEWFRDPSLSDYREYAVVEYIGPGTGDGVDTLYDIERLQFADGAIMLSELIA